MTVYYTFIVKVTNGDNFGDVEEFMNKILKVEVGEVREVDYINKYRVTIDVEDGFDFGYFEDYMDNAGYDTELLWEDRIP